MADFEIIRKYQNYGDFYLDRNGKTILGPVRVSIDDSMFDEDGVPFYKDSKEWAEDKLDFEECQNEFYEKVTLSKKEKQEVIEMLADEYQIILEGHIGEWEDSIYYKDDEEKEQENGRD